jgi:hypothetical protein
MIKTLPMILLIALSLSACSRRTERISGGEGNSTAEMTGPSEVAYGYTFRFALPSSAVTQAQDRHIALCDQMGQARCRLQEMHRSTDRTSSSGSIKFLVVSSEARQFGNQLVAPVTALKGELQSRDFEAEDVSKQIAAGEQKVAAKPTVDNQIALADVRERVATSPVTVVYENSAGFGEQVGNALGAAGETLTSSVSALIYFLAAALPWAIVFTLLFFGIRAIVRRTNRMLARPAIGTAEAPTPTPL